MGTPSPAPRLLAAASAGPLLGVLGVTAVAALVVGCATLVWQILLDGTALRTGAGVTGLPAPLLAQGVLREMLLALPLAAAAALLVRAGAVGPRRPSGGLSTAPGGAGSTGKRPRLAQWAGWTLGFAVTLAWTGSWALFAGTGSFLDSVGVRMATANPVQMVLHALALAPGALVAAPVVALVTWEATWRSVRTTLRWSPDRRARLTAASALALVCITVVGEVGGAWAAANPAHVRHPAKGIQTTVGDLFKELRYARSGPLTHLLSDRRGTASGWADLRPGPEEDLVEWRPRAPWTATEPHDRLNVLVIVVESLRSDELAAYGGPGGVMPAVDDVARDALVFLDHAANATHTNYSWVVPATSQYPLWDPVMRVFTEEPDPPPTRLYDLLEPLGYRTAIVSSQNELWGGMSSVLDSPHLDHFFHAETWEGPTYVPADDGFLSWSREFGRAGKVDDAFTVSEAIDWIGEGAEPFVALLNLQNSHVPYPIPGDAATPFGPRDPGFRIGFNRFPVEEAAAVRGVYRNALHYVDRQIGRLVSHLQTAGLWDRTIVVITGDHGQAFFEHGFAAHGNELFEELLRTPLVIRAPGIPARGVRGLAQHVDVAPTILGLLGMDPHPGFQGQDLLAGPRSHGFSVVQTPMAHQYGIHTGRYKLVFDPGLDRSFLRDVEADPLELRDFSLELDTLAASLRSRLDSWRETQLRYYSRPDLQQAFFPPVPRQ